MNQRWSPRWQTKFGERKMDGVTVEVQGVCNFRLVQALPMQSGDFQSLRFGKMPAHLWIRFSHFANPKFYGGFGREPCRRLCHGAQQREPRGANSIGDLDEMF